MSPVEKGEPTALVLANANSFGRLKAVDRLSEYC
jgi:hypothetical protein